MIPSYTVNAFVAARNSSKVGSHSAPAFGTSPIIFHFAGLLPFAVSIHSAAPASASVRKCSLTLPLELSIGSWFVASVLVNMSAP